MNMKYILYIILPCLVQGLAFSQVTSFDIIWAIENGQADKMEEYLKQGFNVNQKWGKDEDTPLMIAIKKLRIEKKSEVNFRKTTSYAGVSTAGLIGLGLVGIFFVKPQYKELYQDFFNKGINRTTIRNGLIGAVGGIIGLGVLYEAIMWWYDSMKKLAIPLWYRYQVSSSRLMIVQQLINHPKIDLSMKNAEGKMAIDLVKEVHGEGYMADLLRSVEKLLRETMADQGIKIDG